MLSHRSNLLWQSSDYDHNLIAVGAVRKQLLCFRYNTWGWIFVSLTGIVSRLHKFIETFNWNIFHEAKTYCILVPSRNKIGAEEYCEFHFQGKSLKLTFSVVDIEVLLSQHSPSSVIQYHVDLRYYFWT